MALSPEAIIALVTLFVTCPPSLLLAWAFLKRSRRTLFTSRFLPRHRSQSATSQISDQNNLDNPTMSLGRIFYRLNTHSELENWSYNNLRMRAYQTLSPMALPQSTIERELTMRLWDSRSERFEGTVVVERDSVIHSSLGVPAHTIEVV